MSNKVKLILLTHMCMVDGGTVGSEYEAINQSEADSMIRAGYAKLAKPVEAVTVDVAAIEARAAQITATAEDGAKAIIGKAEADAKTMIEKAEAAATDIKAKASQSKPKGK